MRNLVKQKLKKLGFKGKITFKRHNKFNSNLGYGPAIHMRLVDLDYDLNEVMHSHNRDGFNEVVFYLENKSHYEMRERLENKKHVWSEGEINSLRKNLGYCSNWSEYARETLIDDYFRRGDMHCFNITKEQSKKGIDWLKSSQLKKNGQLRAAKSTFLTENEAEIIKNFKKFQFIGLEFSSYNPYSKSHQLIRPIYRTIAKNGDYFDYASSAFNGCELV